jgi:hypothetical protein
MFWYGPIDIWFFLCVGAILLSFLASAMVKLTFNKYNQIQSRGGRTAASIAREMLDDNGLHNVAVVEHAGTLSDHYDPQSQTVALSQSVYNKSTIGAIGVAAHEVGHAIQHSSGYIPIKVRHAIFPVVNFGTRFWYIFLMAGLGLEWFAASQEARAGGITALSSNLILVAILLYACGVAFQLITIPLEIDASNRAMRTISQKGYLIGDEIRGARNVLMAAAFTYIVASLMQLLRLLARTRGRR